MVKQNRVIELDDTRTGTPTTEEFLSEIHRSTALMRENRSEEARAILEAAFESRGDDPSNQATLGLVYFKLGIYPRAAAIYQRLVQDFPNEPTLRLNLGLIHLKTGQTGQAVHELETAVRFDPGYRKAHGYLGLAYQRIGDLFSAKRAFERAGANHLAERLDAVLTEPPPDREATATEQPQRSRSPHPISTDAERTLSQDLAGFFGGRPMSAAPLSDPGSCRQSRHREPVTVAELSATAGLESGSETPFSITEAGHLIMTISARGTTRLDGLALLSGEHLSYTPLHRRFRGKQGEALFGGADTPLFSVTGKGQLLFRSNGAHLTLLRVDEDNAFIKEAHLFAMSEGVAFENGRFPIDGGELTHLSGQGAIVLRTATEISTVTVTPRQGVILRGADLVGWFGRLLPHAVAKGPLPADSSAVEMSGEGVVLLSLSDR